MKEDIKYIAELLAILAVLINAVLTYYLKGLGDSIISTLQIAIPLLIAFMLAEKELNPFQFFVKLIIDLSLLYIYSFWEVELYITSLG